MGARMSQRQQLWWARVRRRGMLHFMVVYGVALWGGLTAAIWMAWMWLTADPDYFAATFLRQPLVLVFGVVLSGVTFGFLLWHMNEMRYKQSLEDNGANS